MTTAVAIDILDPRGSGRGFIGNHGEMVNFGLPFATRGRTQHPILKKEEGTLYLKLAFHHVNQWQKADKFCTNSQ